jgi:hypothetical protein
MKELAALGAAAFIAAASALWFMTKPALVTTEVRPLSPSSAVPTFKGVTNDLQRAPVQQPTNR